MDSPAGEVFIKTFYLYIGCYQIPCYQIFLTFLFKKPRQIFVDFSASILSKNHLLYFLNKIFFGFLVQNFFFGFLEQKT
jgi:hypothetical protein